MFVLRLRQKKLTSTPKLLGVVSKLSQLLSSSPERPWNEVIMAAITSMLEPPHVWRWGGETRTEKGARLSHALARLQDGPEAAHATCVVLPRPDSPSALLRTLEHRYPAQFANLANGFRGRIKMFLAHLSLYTSDCLGVSTRISSGDVRCLSKLRALSVLASFQLQSIVCSHRAQCCGAAVDRG